MPVPAPPDRGSRSAGLSHRPRPRQDAGAATCRISPVRFFCTRSTLAEGPRGCGAAARRGRVGADGRRASCRRRPNMSRMSDVSPAVLRCQAASVSAWARRRRREQVGAERGVRRHRSRSSRAACANRTGMRVRASGSTTCQAPPAFACSPCPARSRAGDVPWASHREGRQHDDAPPRNDREPDVRRQSRDRSPDQARADHCEPDDHVTQARQNTGLVVVPR